MGDGNWDDIESEFDSFFNGSEVAPAPPPKIKKSRGGSFADLIKDLNLGTQDFNDFGTTTKGSDVDGSFEGSTRNRKRKGSFKTFGTLRSLLHGGGGTVKTNGSNKTPKNKTPKKKAKKLKKKLSNLQRKQSSNTGEDVSIIYEVVIVPDKKKNKQRKGSAPSLPPPLSPPPNQMFRVPPVAPPKKLNHPPGLGYTLPKQRKPNNYQKQDTKGLWSNGTITSDESDFGAGGVVQSSSKRRRVKKKVKRKVDRTPQPGSRTHRERHYDHTPRKGFPY